MTLLLPDPSEWQPSADMAGIKRLNGGAAIVRLAYGTSHPDVHGERMRRDAAGFPFLGLYQYIVAGQDIKAQAAVFCGLIGKLAAHEIPVADYEEGDGNQAARFTTWADIVETRTGQRPWLYSGGSYASTHGLAGFFNGSRYHTWVAAYGNTEPTLGHTLWQSTDGKVGTHRTSWPGAGFCDTSVYHGTLTQLAVLIRAGTAPPPLPNKGDAMHGLPGTVLSVQMLGNDGIAKDDIQVWSTDGKDLYVVRWSSATGKWGSVTKVG
jgi:hypothetical protein